MKIAQQLTELVGHTPLLQLNAYSRAAGLEQPLVAKLEMMNPGGSVKDRAAMNIIAEAERSGRLKPGGTIIEPTSGNTGIGLAWLAAVKGYRMIVVMPDTMSQERRKLVQAFGAELHLSDGRMGMTGAVELANRLRARIPGSMIAGQFENLANPRIHELTTAEEIWQDTDGKVAMLIAGVGTGGTLCGTGRRLKQLNANIEVVAVEPADSPLLSQGRTGAHGLQGIGPNFLPLNYDGSVVDCISAVTYDEALRAARLLARTEGLLAGISSGAALAAATELARQQPEGMKVVILPDTGDRYLSTQEFDEENYPLP